MRTKELKINGQKIEAVLVAGGRNFKIYTHPDFNFIIVSGKKIISIPENSPEEKIVAKYVNLKYQNISEQKAIIESFNNLISQIQTRNNPMKKNVAIDSKKGIADLVKFFQEKFNSLSKKEIKEQIEESLSDSGRYSSFGTCFTVTVDGEEFNVIPSFDEFHDIAIDYVTQMLEDEPESFDQDFLQNHTYITDTDKRLIAGDEAEAFIGNMDEDEILERYEDDFADDVPYDGDGEKISINSYEVYYEVNGEEKDEDARKIASEWHGGQFTELYKLSSSGMIDDRDDLEYEIRQNRRDVEQNPNKYPEGELERIQAFEEWAENEIEQNEPDYDKMKEKIYDSHYDYVYNALERDPRGYFVDELGAYTDEEYIKASFVSIDIEAAAKEAVGIDGEAHFLSHYDGNYEETGLGFIVMKE